MPHLELLLEDTEEYPESGVLNSGSACAVESEEIIPSTLTPITPLSPGELAMVLQVVLDCQLSETPITSANVQKLRAMFSLTATHVL